MLIPADSLAGYDSMAIWDEPRTKEEEPESFSEVAQRAQLREEAERLAVAWTRMRPARWWNANPDETPVPGSDAAQMRADLERMKATARMAQLTINASVFRHQLEQQRSGRCQERAVAPGTSTAPARPEQKQFTKEAQKDAGHS